MKYAVVFVILMLAISSSVSACVFDDVTFTNIFKPVVNQNQNQHQSQDQKQNQEQTQTMNVVIPQDSNGLLISNTGAQPVYDVRTLDTTPVKTFSRLVYPDEVLSFPVVAGQVVTINAASDVAFYTVGRQYNDVVKLNGIESIPTYDKFYHRMEWGTVLPMQSIGYFTSMNSITIEEGSDFIVIDNRAPMNTYTHVEYTIEG